MLSFLLVFRKILNLRVVMYFAVLVMLAVPRHLEAFIS